MDGKRHCMVMLPEVDDVLSAASLFLNGKIQGDSFLLCQEYVTESMDSAHGMGGSDSVLMCGCRTEQGRG